MLIRTEQIEPLVIADITDITASAGELNILDGATLTTAELNYVDGVTSDIQTQLNAKLDSSTASSTYQPLDADLTTIAGLTATTDNFIVSVASAWASRTPAQVRTTLGIGSAGLVATDLANLNESTIEAAIDTLANLTSIQGRTITLADAGADALFGWDDSASAYQNLSAADAKTALALVKADVGLGNVDNTSDANKPVSTATQTALDLKSNIASPTFTGTVTLPTTSLTGNLTLAENTSIDLDPAGSADGKYSGICITGTAGTTLAFGDLVYLAVADSRWELADADAATTADRMLGICVLAAASDGNATKILLQGNIRADSVFPALTVGAPVYVGETAGDVQTTIPTGADNVIRRVGYALTADEIYFNPSQDSQISVA